MNAFIDVGCPLPRGSVDDALRAPCRQRPDVDGDLSRRRIWISLGGASERRPNAFSLHPDIAASADLLRR
jgi:hypothetical protein